MNSLLLENLELNFSNHYLTRASQRGISDLAIELLIKYGSAVKKQGLMFWFITKKQMRFVAPEHHGTIKNLVAVMAQDRTLITCYKNQKAIKNIKRKSKYLK